MGKLTKKDLRYEVCGHVRWANVKECPKCGATKNDRACVSCINRQLGINLLRIGKHIDIPAEWRRRRFIGSLTSLMYAPYITKNMFTLAQVPKEDVICPRCGAWRSGADREEQQHNGDAWEIENNILISDGNGGAFVCGVIRGEPQGKRKTGDIVEIVALRADNPRLGRLYDPDKVRGTSVVIYDGVPSCWIPEVKEYLNEYRRPSPSPICR